METSTQDFYEDNNPPNLFGQMCEVSTGVFEPYIPRDKASLTTETCENPLGFRMVTCKDPRRHLFEEEVGGLALDIPLPDTRHIRLPPYIPIFDSDTAFLSSFTLPGNIEVVGLSLIDIQKKGIVSKAGTLHEQDEVVINVSVPLGDAIKGKKVILLPHGEDTLIESFWWQRNDYKIFEYIKAMKFFLVSGMNFSIFRGECSFGQALNHKKSLLSAHLVSQENHPGIPHIYVLDSHDLKRWHDYFVANPQVRLATMNCQMQESNKDIDMVVKVVSEFLNLVPDLRFILNGFHVDHMHKFGPHLVRIHFADKAPVKDARSRMKFMFDIDTLKILKVYSRENVERIVNHNINYRRMYIELIKQRTLEKYRIPNDVLQLIESTFRVRLPQSS